MPAEGPRQPDLADDESPSPVDTIQALERKDMPNDWEGALEPDQAEAPQGPTPTAIGIEDTDLSAEVVAGVDGIDDVVDETTITAG